MASNLTPNFNLCQWEPTDPVVRTDFNADNAKIDAALLAIQSQAAALDTKIDSSVKTLQGADTQLSTKIDNSVKTLQGTDTQLNTKIQNLQNIAFTTSSLPYAVGTYVGNGAVSRFVSLGFTPRAVLVFGEGYFNTVRYSNSNTHYGGLAVSGRNVALHSSALTAWVNGQTILAIVNGGFQVSQYTNDSRSICTNQSGMTYHYIAFK